MNAPFTPPVTAHHWSHAPSAYAWSALVYGGQNPRTGQEQQPMEVQFHRRTSPHGHGYTAGSVIRRANDFAIYNKRSCFAVRGDDGVIYDGPVMSDREVDVVVARLIELPGVDLNMLRKGHRNIGNWQNG